MGRGSLNSYLVCERVMVSMGLVHTLALGSVLHGRSSGFIIYGTTFVFSIRLASMILQIICLYVYLASREQTYTLSRYTNIDNTL